MPPTTLQLYQKNEDPTIIDSSSSSAAQQLSNKEGRKEGRKARQGKGSSMSSSGMNAGGGGISSKDKLTLKQQRKLALASLKSARSGRLSSALDEVLRDDERGGGGDARNGDVYDVLDEEEYREYAERRREREDFVVDDGEFT